MNIRWHITPKDLHAGWIRGKERIITIHSGTFGWEGAPVAIELRLFDRAGRAAGVEQTTFSSGMFPVRVPEKGMAILIRK